MIMEKYMTGTTVHLNHGLKMVGQLAYLFWLATTENSKVRGLGILLIF